LNIPVLDVVSGATAVASTDDIEPNELTSLVEKLVAFFVKPRIIIPFRISHKKHTEATSRKASKPRVVKFHGLNSFMLPLET